MSNLEKIKEAGLEEELNTTIANFVDNGSDDDVAKLQAEIDASGLKSPAVMKLIGTYQRNNVLKPGLYKELVAINNKVGSNGQSTEEEKVEDPIKATAEEGEAPSAEEDEMEFSEKQEAKIKERMQKEEAKMRERLLKKEQKIRDRLAGRAEKRAQRLGVKVEEAKEIQEKKELLAKKREEYKQIRDEMKKIREDIKELRPARSKMADEERNFKVWNRKTARLEKRVAKWKDSDEDNAAEKLAKSEEKLEVAKQELAKASVVYDEWKAKQPPEEEKASDDNE